MSVEKQTTAPPSTGPDSTPAIESIEKTTPDHLSSDNKNLFSRLCGGAKSFVGKQFESITKLPVVDRIYGKIGISYNNSLVNKNETKIKQINEKAGALNLQIKSNESAKAELESSINDLLGVKAAEDIMEAMKKELSTVENRLGMLQTQSKMFESRFNDRQEKLDLYKSKRDSIVDRFVDKYEKKAEPLREKAEELEQNKNKLDLVLATAKANHAEKHDELKALKDKIPALKNALEAAGHKPKAIENHPALKKLNESVAKSEKQMKEAEDEIGKKIKEVSSKIERATKKINTQEAKRDKFKEIKEKKPNIEEFPKPAPAEIGGDLEVNAPNTKSESAIENPEHQSVESFVNGWNQRVEKARGRYNIDSNKKIDLDKFSALTQYGKDRSIYFDRWEDMVVSYLVHEKAVTANQEGLEKLRTELKLFKTSLKTNK